MTWLIWKIRSWFCSHAFRYDECRFDKRYMNQFGQYYGDSIAEIRVSATCTKCGWHLSYKKY